MTESPLLSVNETILWLKVLITAATLVVLYVRHRSASAPDASARNHPAWTRWVVIAGVFLSFGVFHNLGEFRGGTFVHHGEMFHYYLGPKYFEELGYYELYNAVLVADAEEGNELARLPFYTDLRTYQNAPRSQALRDGERVRGLFSQARWREFKSDVAFFKEVTSTPEGTGAGFFLMDHGYNGSPVTTFVLGLITNAAAVTQLTLLASFDVLLVIAMALLVFRTFGLAMGALFSVYFCVNALNAYDYVSGSLLRYDWLLCIVAAVCGQARGRYALSGCLLALAAMLRVFPAVLFVGLGIVVIQRWRATRSVERSHVRFMIAAAVTGLALLVLPAVSLGSVVGPWKDFATNTALHSEGVYVNHLGFSGIALFEPSHLSLERFVEKYQTARTPDVVRHWQDVKEYELGKKKPLIYVVSGLVLLCLVAIVRKREESEGLLWPLLLIYTLTFPALYYYGFLCLFVLLFFRRERSEERFFPLAALMTLNLGVLVADSFALSPIVFYTWVNIGLFVCLSSILGFELRSIFVAKAPAAAGPTPEPARVAPRGSKGRKRRGKRRK